MKLFAVYLGGRAPKGNTELHDVVFVAGTAIEATYDQLLEQWFGSAEGLHLDSWIELDIVDGYQVVFSETPPEGDKKLYFINLGAYQDGEFTEIHANTFLVASSKPEAKARAKAALRAKGPAWVHTDNLMEVDDCIELQEVGARRITLAATDQPENLRPVNGYHIIPEPEIEKHKRRKSYSAI